MLWLCTPTVQSFRWIVRPCRSILQLTQRAGRRDDVNTNDPGPRPQLLRIAEVAQRLETSKRFVWSQIALGKLRATRLGGRCTRVSLEALNAYLRRAEDGEA